MKPAVKFSKNVKLENLRCVPSGFTVAAYREVSAETERDVWSSLTMLATSTEAMTPFTDSRPFIEIE